MTFTYDVSMFKQLFEHDFTWINGFMRNVRRYSEKPAMCCAQTGQTWTYSSLNAEANKFSNAMLQDGIKKNDVVMYMLYNCPEFVFIYVASHKIGAISSPVNFRQAPGELASLIDSSKPSIFIYDAEFAEIAEKALSLSQFKPRRTLFTGDDKFCSRNDTLKFSEYIENRESTSPTLSFEPHIYDETLRLYTSGTTNIPKAVPVNNINEVLTSHDVMMHFPLNCHSKTMNMTPWFHRGGVHAGGPTPTLYAGAEIVVLREFNPKQCLTIIQNEGISLLVGVPSILALLARAQEKQRADLSSLQAIITMGSPFEKSACEDYLKILSPNIYNGYGTTETFWNTFLSPFDLPQLAGTAGKSCTDDEVRIVHSFENRHAEPDELVKNDNKHIGEIIIKSVAKSTCCYVNNDDMTQKKFYKGYHYTGDLGTWDENGFITVVSRKDDMILSNGENIFPAQIEAILNEHPGVLESGVVGMPDRLHGQCVVAFIVPCDDALTVDDLKSYCIAHPMLPSYKRPKFYYFVKELPHNPTGKLLRSKLRSQLPLV